MKIIKVLHWMAYIVIVTILLLASLLLDIVVLGDYDWKNHNITMDGLYRIGIYIIIFSIFLLLKSSYKKGNKILKINILFIIFSIGGFINHITGQKIMSDDSYQYLIVLIGTIYIINQIKSKK